MADPAQRDYVAIALAYARRAADPKNCARFGVWIRLAAQRFLNDLERAQKIDAPFTFSAWHANDPCDFIEKLPHIEGVWDTPTITLVDAHVFFLVQLFGFRERGGLRDGMRRFTTALFAVARKNAKSTLASGIGLYCETCEGENGPQVITAATTGSQARIVFNVAKAMVDKTADLRSAFSMTTYVNAIACYSNGGTFKPINAKASTQDGLNPSCSILDELHAHKNHDLMNVLRSAAGARRNPLFLYLTTEGYANPGPWEEEREFAKKVLRGVVEADHYLALYYALDEADDDLGTREDDEFDEATWIKANPLIEVNPLLRAEIQKAAIEAKQKPGTHAEFKIKRCNRASSVAKGWTNITKWKACRAPLNIEELRRHPCHGGLDLSSTTDLTSFRLVWSIDDWLYTMGWRYVPRAAVRRRTTRGLIPYAGWVLKGYLIETGNEAIDYAPIEEKIIEVNETFNLVSVAYDGWNATQTVQRLNNAGVNMVQFIQGPKSYHPAMQALEAAYLEGRVAYGEDPVLNWNMSNLVARVDANMNQAPDKKRAAEKIDDACALLMGVGHATANAETDDAMAEYLRSMGRKAVPA